MFQLWKEKLNWCIWNLLQYRNGLIFICALFLEGGIHRFLFLFPSHSNCVTALQYTSKLKKYLTTPFQFFKCLDGQFQAAHYPAPCRLWQTLTWRALAPGPSAKLQPGQTLLVCQVLSATFRRQLRYGVGRRVLPALYLGPTVRYRIPRKHHFHR